MLSQRLLIWLEYSYLQCERRAEDEVDKFLLAKWPEKQRDWERLKTRLKLKRRAAAEWVATAKKEDIPRHGEEKEGFCLERKKKSQQPLTNNQVLAVAVLSAR